MAQDIPLELRRAWQRADVPLDLNGPVGVAYEPPPADFAEHPIYAWFEQRVRRDPAAIALVSRTQRLTYGEVHARSLDLAWRVADSVPRGQAVALWLPSDALLPVAVLACLAAGRTALVLNHRNPAARIASIIQDAAPAAVVHPDTGGYRAAIPEGIGSIPLADRPPADTPARWRADLAVEPDEPAVVLYTSGSTGVPKGIVLPQRAILTRIRQVVTAWHMHRADSFLSLSTPPTIPGLTGCLAALLSGCPQIAGDLLDDGMGGILGLARRERVTILVGLPTMLGGFAEVGGSSGPLADLRIVRTTGDALLRDALQAWRRLLPPGCHVMTTFGSTEMLTLAQWFVPAGFQPDEARLPVGYPLPDHEFAVVDEEHRPVAAGEAGELVLRSRAIAMGEWRAGAWVPGRFIGDPDDASRRILFTGDLIRQRADGMIGFVGRRDTQVKVRGQRIEPAEIEGALRAQPGVAAAAVAAERNGDDVLLHAFVVAEGMPSRPDEFIARLRAGLTQTLPHYMVPSTLALVQRLPHLASGKVDRRALLEAAGRRPG
jgi:acyl-coenzyme A synthetase/AMP-(fatty) acid ligase